MYEITIMIVTLANTCGCRTMHNVTQKKTQVANGKWPPLRHTGEIYAIYMCYFRPLSDIQGRFMPFRCVTSLRHTGEIHVI